MASKVLLIGGNRFLGRTIADAFIRDGNFDLYTLNRGTRPAPEQVKQILCDKTDKKAFAEVLTQCRWDVIVDTMLNDEELEFVIETIGSNVGHFIHTGSLGVYGEAKHIPITEAVPLAEYDESKGDEVVFNYKIRQDQVLIRAHQERNFPATILRMSYIYGPGDSLLDGWGGRSPAFFQMMRDEPTIFLPEDGRALLHPGHVKDLGASFLNAALHPESIGQIYNICGPHALMMKDYIQLIANAMGVNPTIEYLPSAELLARWPKIINERGMKFAGQHMCASIAKAERELKWRPIIPLEAGIRENIAWMRDQNII